MYANRIDWTDYDRVTGKKTATKATETAFQEVFNRAIEENWKAGDAELARRAGLKSSSNVYQVRKSNPREVTDTIQAICRVIGISADALVLRHEIVRIDPPAAAPPAGSVVMGPTELAEAAAYIAILDTDEGKALRVLVRQAYERLHSGKP